MVVRQLVEQTWSQVTDIVRGEAECTILGTRRHVWPNQMPDKPLVEKVSYSLQKRIFIQNFSTALSIKYDSLRDNSRNNCTKPEGLTDILDFYRSIHAPFSNFIKFTGMYIYVPTYPIRIYYFCNILPSTHLNFLFLFIFVE